MALRQYDPKSVLIVLGAIPVSGFADGTFCAIEFREDAFMLQIGADGEGARSRSNDRSASITFTLQQTSQSNALLSALHVTDIASPGGAGCVPLLVKDALGNSIFAAEKAWIVKMPVSEYGREAGTREWKIETDRLDALDGGN